MVNDSAGCQGAAEVCIEEDQDPTAKLLAGGLEPLLKTIVDSTGDNRHPGIFVSFQDLHFFARTFCGSSMQGAGLAISKCLCG